MKVNGSEKWSSVPFIVNVYRSWNTFQGPHRDCSKHIQFILVYNRYRLVCLYLYQNGQFQSHCTEIAE